MAAVQTVVAVTRQEPVQGRKRAESGKSETGHKAGAMMVSRQPSMEDVAAAGHKCQFVCLLLDFKGRHHMAAV